MTRECSIISVKVRSRWTVLPPLKLKGVGTHLVESVPSYVSRLLWTTGVPLAHLARYVGERSLPGAGHYSSFVHAEALNAIAISRIVALEGLTGERQLRCGSLWALSEIVSYNTSAYGKFRRQWCPRCYADWNEESYEPLLWRIDLLGACPMHQCRMECTCPRCGKFQLNEYKQQLRRICRSCGESLANGATWLRRPPFATWVDDQVVQLVEFCATPREAPAPLSIYTDFATGLRINAKNSGRRDAVMRLLLRNIDRHARRNSRRPTLRSLLNVCSLQGISVQELLFAPRQVSGPMLFEQWPCMTYLPLPSAVQAQRIYAASKYLKDFLALEPPFLPPMKLLLRCFHIQLRALRDVASDTFDFYERRYLDQGGAIRLARLRRAFVCAQRTLVKSGKKGDLNFVSEVKKIARLVDVTRGEAAIVLRTAKIMRATQVTKNLDRYRAELPLRSALNWFIDQRRFS